MGNREYDRTVGRNLVGLRGEMSQQALADRMRVRGHKWTQATVWSIEKGERSLKLEEAIALADVLGLATFAITELGEEGSGHFMQVAHKLNHLHQAVAGASQDFAALIARVAIDAILLDEAKQLPSRGGPAWAWRSWAENPVRDELIAAVDAGLIEAAKERLIHEYDTHEDLDKMVEEELLSMDELRVRASKLRPERSDDGEHQETS